MFLVVYLELLVYSEPVVLEDYIFLLHPIPISGSFINDSVILFWEIQHQIIYLTILFKIPKNKWIFSL